MRALEARTPGSQRLQLADAGSVSAVPDTCSRQEVVARLERLMTDRGTTLANEIVQRNLYFRISLVGNCNLRCSFCHNEGGPTTGLADLDFVASAVSLAASVGFRRVQFTGGEPLLHKQLCRFVEASRRHLDDVGVTTNGTMLVPKLPGLIDAGTSRIHVSLQEESLARHENASSWEVPSWLGSTLNEASKGRFLLRLNLPVPRAAIRLAADFLRRISIFGCDVKVFAILPEGAECGSDYPLAELASMVSEENRRRLAAGERGEIVLRDFRSPQGLRCPSCLARSRCKEQSHSLRLGVDRILRPCLATRRWDSALSNLKNFSQLRDAAILALDYSWS